MEILIKTSFSSYLHFIKSVVLLECKATRQTLLAIWPRSDVMRQFFLVFLVVCMAVMAMDVTTIAQTRKGSLYGWVVVLDSGHGGMDPGASGVFQGKRVVEDEYVFDVALRVRRMIRAKGGLVIMTTTDRVGERSWEAFKVFPDA